MLIVKCFVKPLRRRDLKISQIDGSGPNYIPLQRYRNIGIISMHRRWLRISCLFWFILFRKAFRTFLNGATSHFRFLEPQHWTCLCSNMKLYICQLLLKFSLWYHKSICKAFNWDWNVPDELILTRSTIHKTIWITSQPYAVGQCFLPTPRLRIEYLSGITRWWPLTQFQEHLTRNNYISQASKPKNHLFQRRQIKSSGLSFGGVKTFLIRYFARKP